MLDVLKYEQMSNNLIRSLTKTYSQQVMVIVFALSVCILTIFLFTFKDLNKELSLKLEAQTQRLELLAAQSMVNENIQARPTDSRTVHENAAYTDEGDEVSYLSLIPV